jgi:hypothetical protein
MKLFLTKIILFFVIFAAYMGVNYKINSAASAVASDLEVENCKILIIGDSYAMRAVDPQMIDGAMNVCQGAEPYFISYWKLKALLERNPDIDTVLLGFSHHNLSAFNDKKLVDPRWAAEMSKRIYAYGDLKALEGVEIDWHVYLKTVFENMCLYPKDDHVHFLGEYKNSRHSDISGVQDAIQKHFYYDGENVGTSSVAVGFLKRIVALCKEKNVKLALLQCPVHELYWQKIPASFRKEFTRVRREMIEEGIVTIRFEGPRLVSKEFLNCDHLNLFGAQKYSRVVKMKLEEIRMTSK